MKSRLQLAVTICQPLLAWHESFSTTRGSVFREKRRKTAFSLSWPASVQKKAFTYETPSLTPTGLRMP